MGDLNQLDYVVQHRDMVNAPILEIGSKDYGNTNDYRKLFPDARYIGIDQEPGKGVDAVCDFTRDYASISRTIGEDRFGTIFCFSVLEHCRDPFMMARNMTDALEKGGVLFLSVPFVWNLHAYPDDFWRFTPSSLGVLFPELEILAPKSCYTTKTRGEWLPLDTNLAAHRTLSPPFLARAFRKLGLIRPLYPYVLAPVMINAILQKKHDSGQT